MSRYSPPLIPGDRLAHLDVSVPRFATEQGIQTRSSAVVLPAVCTRPNHSDVIEVRYDGSGGDELASSAGHRFNGASNTRGVSFSVATTNEPDPVYEPSTNRLLVSDGDHDIPDQRHDVIDVATGQIQMRIRPGDISGFFNNGFGPIDLAPGLVVINFSPFGGTADLYSQAIPASMTGTVNADDIVANELTSGVGYELAPGAYVPTNTRQIAEGGFIALVSSGFNPWGPPSEAFAIGNGPFYSQQRFAMSPSRSFRPRSNTGHLTCEAVGNGRLWGGSSSLGFRPPANIFRIDFSNGEESGDTLIGNGDLWSLDYLTGEARVYNMSDTLGDRPQAVLARHGWTWVFISRPGGGGWRAYMFEGDPVLANLVWTANVESKIRTMDADQEGRLYIDGLIYSSVDGSIIWGVSDKYYARWLAPRES